MNLILTDQDLNLGSTVVLPARTAEYLVRISKIEPGFTLKVGQINGPAAWARVLRANKEKVELEVTDPLRLRDTVPMTVILGLPRPQMLKRIFELAGTFAVERLYLVCGERSQKSYLDSRHIEQSNIRKHLLLGMEQGISTLLPRVQIDSSGLNVTRLQSILDEWSLEGSDQYQRIVFQPDSEDNLLDHLTGSPSRGKNTRPGGYVLAVGCEGGWSPEERKKFREMKFTELTLGDSVLRVDTAFTAALAQLELCHAGIRPLSPESLS